MVYGESALLQGSNAGNQAPVRHIDQPGMLYLYENN